MNRIVYLMLLLSITTYYAKGENCRNDAIFHNKSASHINNDAGIKSQDFLHKNVDHLWTSDALISMPSNDNACNAEMLVLEAPPVAGNVVEATLETNEVGGSCWLSGPNNTVWYSFVAPGSGLVQISTDFVTGLNDSQMTLFAISDCSDLSTATQVGCSENNGFTGSGNMAVISTASSPLIGGETYHVQIDGFGSSVGVFNIQVVELPPANDNCDAAKLLATNGNGALIGEFFAAATDSGKGTEICDNNSTPTPADIWYEIQTGGVVENLVIVVEPGLNSDIVVAVYDSCVSLFAESCVDLGGVGGSETINLMVNSDTYYLRIYEKNESGESLEIGVQGEILPIILGKFEAKKEIRGNLLQWSTLSETNSDIIEILASSDGRHDWKSIGKVDAYGESNSLKEYEFVDFNPYPTSYYRLNAIDKDGRSEYSPIIMVNRSDDANGRLILAPNPASHTLTLQTSFDEATQGTLAIMDMSGRLVMSRFVALGQGLNTINVDLDELKVGMYSMSLLTNKGLQVEKFVKQ